MINQNDLRVRKTARAITTAFMDLLAKEPFSAISVVQLADHAEIGQTTFYNHYHDKYELAVDLIRATTRQLATIFVAKFGLNIAPNDSPVSVDEADYPKLLAQARLLMKIETPEIDFHLITVDCMTKMFTKALQRYQLPTIDLSAVAAHLATVAFSFIFQTHTADPKPLAAQVEEFNQFYLVLSRLHAATVKSSK